MKPESGMQPRATEVMEGLGPLIIEQEQKLDRLHRERDKLLEKPLGERNLPRIEEIFQEESVIRDEIKRIKDLALAPELAAREVKIVRALEDQITSASTAADEIYKSIRPTEDS